MAESNPFLKDLINNPNLLSNSVDKLVSHVNENKATNSASNTPISTGKKIRGL